MWLTLLALRNRIGVLMLSLAMVILGGTSVQRLPVDLFPQIQVPVAFVGVIYKGAFVDITARKTENSGTVSNKVIELGFQFLKATGVGPVNFPDASTANGAFFYNVTPNFGVTLLAYTGQFGTGGSVNIDVLNIATKTIAGRFNLVVKELLTGIAHTNTGSFRVRW